MGGFNLLQPTEGGRWMKSAFLNKPSQSLLPNLLQLQRLKGIQKQTTQEWQPDAAWIRSRRNKGGDRVFHPGCQLDPCFEKTGTSWQFDFILFWMGLFKECCGKSACPCCLNVSSTSHAFIQTVAFLPPTVNTSEIATGTTMPVQATPHGQRRQ